MLENLRNTAAAIALATALAVTPITARADSATASLLFGSASAVMVSGTHLAWGADPKGLGLLPFLPAFSVFGVVYAVGKTVEGTTIVIETSIDGSKRFAEILIKGSKASAIKAGQSIDAIFTGVGHVLKSDGRVLAFLPDETGTALLHHEELN